MKDNTHKISEKNIVEWDEMIDKMENENKVDPVWGTTKTNRNTEPQNTIIGAGAHNNISVGPETLFPDKKDNSFILSCFTLTAVGIFHFFLTWYAIYYDSSIKSSLIIIFGFAIYILSIIIYHLKSVIKEKEKDFYDMGNRWGRETTKVDNLKHKIRHLEKEKLKSKEWKEPEWLKAMQDEKLVREALEEVLKYIPNDDLTVDQLERLKQQYPARFGTTGKLLLSREERSRKCREGAIKRWKRVKEAQLTTSNFRSTLTPRQIAGSKGGKKGWEGLTTEQRTQRAKRSARARWLKKNKGE